MTDFHAVLAAQLVLSADVDDDRDLPASPDDFAASPVDTLVCQFVSREPQNAWLLAEAQTRRRQIAFGNFYEAYIEASQRLFEQTAPIADALRNSFLGEVRFYDLQGVAFQHGPSREVTAPDDVVTDPDVAIAEPYQPEFPLAGGFSPSKE